MSKQLSIVVPLLNEEESLPELVRWIAEVMSKHQYSYELIMGNRRLEKIDATRGATSGSWYSLERVYKTYQESKMNEDALRELTESFDRETEPTVTEIAGKLVQLHGTLDFQVDEWRRLLRQAWQQETAL